MFRPDRRIFKPELVSLSCTEPHPTHTHDLTPRPFNPFGPPSAKHVEQVWVLYRSSVFTYLAPRRMADLYESIERNEDQPASRTDFAIRVRASAPLFTSPTQIKEFSLTRRVEVTCRKCRLWAAIFLCILRVCFFLPARCAVANFAAAFRT